MAFWLFSWSTSSFPCQPALDFTTAPAPQFFSRVLAPDFPLSGSLSSGSVLCSQPTPSLQISLVVLLSQSHFTGSSFNSPCQNGTGFLPQISNINLTSRCPLLPCHQLLVPDDLLVPYCLPAFSCQSFQPVIKSHSVSLLPTSVPGSCPHYLTCLLYLLLSHSVLLHIS